MHEHIGLTGSSKPCLNLSSFRWLNCSLRCLKSFTPTGFLTAGLSLFHYLYNMGENFLLKVVDLEGIGSILVDMSWRRLEDIMETTKYLLGISVYLSGDSKSKCVSNESIFHKSISDNSKANPKCIN